MAGKKDIVKDSDRKSIITPYLDRCFICGSTDRVAIHEIFGGTSNRKKSKEDSLCLPLCYSHHNGSKNGVHFNKELDDTLKKLGEKIWLEKCCDKELPHEEKLELFIKRYGKNYLED